VTEASICCKVKVDQDGLQENMAFVSKHTFTPQENLIPMHG